MLALQAQSALTVSFRFALGLIAGTLATLAMDLLMSGLPEGDTPPKIAAGVLTETDPAAAPGRLASVVHYLAGGLTGPLFVWFLFAFEGLFGGPSLTVTLGTTVVMFLLMIGFFGIAVLPRSLVADGRESGILRDWAVSAAGYLAVLVPVVAAGSSLL